MNSTVCYVAHKMDSINGWGRVSRMITAAAKQQNLSHYVLAHKADHTQNLLTPLADNSLKPFLSYLDAVRHYNVLRKSDLIHCLTEPMIPFALAAHNLTGAALVLNLYGTYAVKSLTSNLAAHYRSAYSRAAALIVPSQFTAKQLLSHCPQLESKIHIIPLASCFDRSPQSKPFKDRQPAALFVGEIKKRKGLLPLLEATKTAVHSGELDKLYIVGKVIDQDYYRQLKNYIDQESLGTNVVFTGAISDAELSELYSNCRVSILPSVPKQNSFEGFGLIHLESFAHATPSIGSRNSGSEAAIVDAYNGLLVDPLNVKQLSHAIIRIVGDESIWNVLSQNSRLNLKSWEDVMTDLKKIYSAI